MTTKNKRYPVNRLIRLAFLEGAISTRGLYEKIVLTREEADMKENPPQATFRKLFREFDDAGLPTGRTAGEFLRQIRLQQGLTAFAAHRLLDIPLLTYRMLENDSVSPMNVPLSAWKRVKAMGKISWVQLEELIRASHYLMVFRPSYKGTLLRYRKKTSHPHPPDARVSAARELYLRARLPLPPFETQSIERYLRELRAGNSDNGND